MLLIACLVMGKGCVYVKPRIVNGEYLGDKWGDNLAIVGLVPGVKILFLKFSVKGFLQV